MSNMTEIFIDAVYSPMAVGEPDEINPNGENFPPP